MRDSLKDRAKDLASGGSWVFKPSLLEVPESRELTKKSVLYLSALLTFGGFNQAINRGEPHLSMWFSLGVTVVALVWVAEQGCAYLLDEEGGGAVGGVDARRGREADGNSLVMR